MSTCGMHTSAARGCREGASTPSLPASACANNACVRNRTGGRPAWPAGAAGAWQRAGSRGRGPGGAYPVQTAARTPTRPVPRTLHARSPAHIAKVKQALEQEYYLLSLSKPRHTSGLASAVLPSLAKISTGGCSLRQPGVHTHTRVRDDRVGRQPAGYRVVNTHPQ